MSVSPVSSSPKSTGTPTATEVAAIEVGDGIQADVDDADSALGSDDASSTASLTSSILHYRTRQGRTYHSERGNANYCHHMLTLVLDDELQLAPLGKNIQKVLDIGTGTDQRHRWGSYANPNWMSSEIEDCTQEWTFDNDSIDHVHMRYLVGSIVDWTALFKESFRVCKPGGWVESYEGIPKMESDDGTVPDESAMATWGRIFIKAGKKLGRSFTVVEDGVQEQGMKEAGFVDIQSKIFKMVDMLCQVPVGGWAKDPEQRQIGHFARVHLETDMEGHVLSLPGLLRTGLKMKWWYTVQSSGVNLAQDSTTLISEVLSALDSFYFFHLQQSPDAAMALKLCLLQASLALADGVGLIGYGKTMYYPACAFACRGVIKSCPLACTPKEGGESHGMGHSMSTTPQECYTSDPAFLKTMALCIDTYCPGSDAPELMLLEDYWRGHLATGTVGTMEWKPVMSYQEALSGAQKDEDAAEKQTGNSTSSSRHSDHTARKIKARHGGHTEEAEESASTEPDTALPIAVASEPLNATSFVLQADWQKQYNVVLSLFRFVPALNRSVSWTWLNSVLTHPPAWGNSHRSPVAAHFGGGLIPTRGQLLYILLISLLNFIFLIAPYYNIQPQSTFATLREQEVSTIGNRAGVLALGNMVALFVFSSRNSILLQLTDWSYGTFLLLHRWLGYWTILHSVLHSIMLLVYYKMFGDYEAELVQLYWIWGIVATVATVIIWPTSLLVVRQKAYEVFLATHQVMALLFLIGYYYHIWYRYEYNWGYEIWMFVASGIWALERLVRLVRMAGRGLRTATVSAIDGSDREYLKIVIDDVSVHGVVYLCFPTLCWRFWETHPFSVASSLSLQGTELSSGSEGHDADHGQEKSVSMTGEEADATVTAKMSPVCRATFYVRTRSGMTSKLATKVASSGGAIRLPVLIEGSYHSSPLQKLSHCTDLVCFAGGVGITTMLRLVQENGARSTRVYWGLRNESLQRELNDQISGLPRTVSIITSVGKRMNIAEILQSELTASGGSKDPVGILVSGPPGMADDVRVAASSLGRSGGLRRGFVLIDEGFSW
ncbi:ferric-chelate reductase [Fusarium albosuccineum]|uniref:Ferric-chelate reductase n=1 Tax=Fusarium albosuccineum TaxID=1237068 RepID=A0A8H4LDT0_9HYPO|nr:ferric-chelate reductase [Fusarium albosuccineum]